jgi:hypothetical protein
MGEESTTSNAVGSEEAAEKPVFGNPLGGWLSLQKATRRRDAPEIYAMVQLRSREERLGARVRRRGSCRGDSSIFRVRLR